MSNNIIYDDLKQKTLSAFRNGVESNLLIQRNESTIQEITDKINQFEIQYQKHDELTNSLNGNLELSLNSLSERQKDIFLSKSQYTFIRDTFNVSKEKLSCYRTFIPDFIESISVMLHEYPPLINTLNDYKLKLASLKDELLCRKTIIQNLHTKLSEIKISQSQYIIELNDETSKYKKLQENISLLEVKQKQNSTTKNNLVIQIEQLNKDLSILKHNFNILQDKGVQINDKITTVNSTLGVEVQNLKNEIVDLKNDTLKHSQEYEKLKEKETKLIEDNSKIQAELMDYFHKINDFDKINMELEAQSSRKTNEYNSLNTENHGLQLNIDTLKTDNDQITMRLNEIDTEMNKLRKNISENEMNQNKYKEEIRLKLNIKNELENKCTIELQKISKDSTEYEKTSKEIQACSKSLKILQKDIERLKTKNEKASTKNKMDSEFNRKWELKKLDYNDNITKLVNQEKKSNDYFEMIKQKRDQMKSQYEKQKKDNDDKLSTKRTELINKYKNDRIHEVEEELSKKQKEVLAKQQGIIGELDKKYQTKFKSEIDPLEQELALLKTNLN